MKKVLITLMVALSLLFTLTLVASAEKVTYEGKEIELVNNLGDPSWYTGNTALAIKDKESIVILKDSEGNMKAFPSYYILRFGVDVSDGVVTQAYVLWADKNGVDYSFINEKLGTSYASGSIYYIEFPYDMTKCMGNSIFGKDDDSKPEPNFVEVVIPDSVTVIDQQAFRRMNSCKKVTMSKNVKEIPSWAFCGSTKLETVVFPEGSLLESTGNSFSGCTALSSINLENCTNLKTLGGSAFDGCTSLRKLSLPDSIETIGVKAFYRIGEFELASDYLPKNLTSIGTHFLSGCTVVNEVLYFPEGLTDMSASWHFNDGFSPKTEMTLVFFGKMTNVNLANAGLTAWTNSGSKKPLTIVFAQNTFDELNGDFLQGTTLNGKDGYIVNYADGTTPYTYKESGTLTVKLCDSDPNSQTNLGTDANGNTVYQAQGAPAELIFCGGENVSHCYSVRTSKTDKTTNNNGYYRFFTTVFDYDIDAHKTAGVHWDKIEVLSLANCGYDGVTKDTCVACKRVIETVVEATGNHKYTVDNDCTTEHACEVCEKIIVEALEHVLKDIIKYENGYMAAGTCTNRCTNEGCEHSVSSTEVAALFVNKGYTKDETENGSSLAYGISINKAAIEAYEKASGEVVTYGFIIGAVPDTPTGNLVSANGEILLAGAVSVNLTEIDYSKYSIYNVKLTSITTDNQKALDIYFNAYAIVEGKVRYFGEEETETAVAISYNSIK